MEGPGQAGVKCRPCPEPIARLVQLQTPGSKWAGPQGKFIGSQRGQAQRWASGPAGARVSDVIVTGLCLSPLCFPVRVGFSLRRAGPFWWHRRPLAAPARNLSARPPW